VFIHELNSCGATAHMIAMLSPTCNHSEYVVWKVLVVLNNIVYKDGSETKFMVEKELVARVLPLCQSTCKRVRLQALWIIGNMSVQIEPALESRIYTSGVVGTLVKVSEMELTYYLCFLMHPSMVLSAELRDDRQDDEPRQSSRQRETAVLRDPS